MLKKTQSKVLASITSDHLPHDRLRIEAPPLVVFASSQHFALGSLLSKVQDLIRYSFLPIGELMLRDGNQNAMGKWLRPVVVSAQHDVASGSIIRGKLMDGLWSHVATTRDSYPQLDTCTVTYGEEDPLCPALQTELVTGHILQNGLTCIKFGQR